MAVFSVFGLTLLNTRIKIIFNQKQLPIIAMLLICLFISAKVITDQIPDIFDSGLCTSMLCGSSSGKFQTRKHNLKTDISSGSMWALYLREQNFSLRCILEMLCERMEGKGVCNNTWDSYQGAGSLFHGNTVKAFKSCTLSAWIPSGAPSWTWWQESSSWGINTFPPPHSQQESYFLCQLLSDLWKNFFIFHFWTPGTRVAHSQCRDNHWISACFPLY